MIVFSFITPQAFSDNEFCKIQENLKIQEELIKDNVVLIEFLKVFPNAKLIRANYVDESNPEQTSMTWIAGLYSLDIHIWGFDKNNPSDCFFPGGYRLNAPHLPKMIGLEYHKDPTIVLGQIDELEPKYVKGGPELIDSAPISEPEPEHMPNEKFPSGAIVDCIGGLHFNGTACVPDDVLEISYGHQWLLKIILIITILIVAIVGIIIGVKIWRKRK